MMKERSTIDIVVILMASSVGIVLFTATLGAIIGKIIHPEVDISKVAELITNVVTTLVGALVGFMGGRAQGKYEAKNGGS